MTGAAESLKLHCTKMLTYVYRTSTQHMSMRIS